MIKIVYGPKGFGKTKIIKDDINAAAKTAKGNVVFITDKKIYTVDIDLNVKCIYAEEYNVASVNGFAGFVQGLIAGNNDIEYIFIDGLKRITKEENLEVYEEFFGDIVKLTDANGITVEVSVSADKNELPKFMLNYIG